MFSRRRILKTVAAASAISVIGGPRVAKAELHENLNDAFSEFGFDPTAPGNTFIVLLTDIHLDPISRNYNTPTIDDRLVNNIMAMSPAPSRIVFLGDLAICCTERFGMTLTEDALERSLAELERGKQELERFAPIPISLMLGNHDQYNYDNNGSVWRQVFPNLPTYQLLQIGGMKWFLLNGGHSGYIDAPQEAWLAQQVATIDPAEDLVICVHQPALHSPSTERGIGRTIGRVFAQHTGKIWMFAGHAHRFNFTRYLLPQTTISLVGVTTANPEAFNDGRNPGFMVVCLSNGHLAGMVMRDCKKTTYQLFNPTLSDFPVLPIPKTWSSVQFPIRLFEEGSYDRGAILVAANGDDTGTWWSYAVSLTFRVPMHPRADQFVLLAGMLDPAPIFEFSINDGATWTQATGVTTTMPEQIHTVPLPQYVRNTAAPWVRVSNPVGRSGFGWEVSGFGIAASPESVSTLEGWRYDHFGTILNEGQASLTANPAGDGLNNLAKFAFGLDPKKPDRRVVNPEAADLGGEPILRVQKNSSDVGVQATFLRRTASDMPGLQYRIQHSSDLKNWQEVTGNVETVTQVDADWELVNTWIPQSTNGPAEYWRINVVL
jgi:hypothetical protein